MNSISLKENGFVDAIPLKGLQFTSLPNNKSGVLILTDFTLTGQPTSDILYIGKTKNPTKRIFGGYIAGCGGKTTRKIHSLLFDDGFIEKVAVTWMTANNSRTAKKELLENFKKEHGQYPAWNITKKPQPQTKAKIKPKANVKKMVKKVVPAIKKAKSIKPKTKKIS